MLGHPALVAAEIGGNTEREALLAEQDVPAVTGVDGADVIILREVDDIAVFLVDVLFAWIPLIKSELSPSASRTFWPIRVMMFMFRTT